MLRVLNHHYISLRRFIIFFTESLVIILCLYAVILGFWGAAAFSNNQSRGASLILSALVYEIFLFWFDLYGCQDVHRNGHCMAKLILSLLMATLTLSPLYQSLTGLSFASGILFVLFITFVLMGAVVGVRWIVPTLLDHTEQLKHRLLILGSGAGAAALICEIQMNVGSGIAVVGTIIPHAPVKDLPPQSGVRTLDSAEDLIREETKEVSVLLCNGNGSSHVIGTLENLDEIVRKEHIDTIVVSMEDRWSQGSLLSLLRLKMQGVRIVDAVSFYERYKGQISLADPWLNWMVFSDGCKKDNLTLAVKRLIDIVGSLAALLLVFPILILTAIMIKLDSPGPIIFSQWRPGLGGKLFRVYKFRSMYTNADPDRLVVNGDHRITRVGHIMRRMRLDELPQLFNVILGDMSVVGPRPELISVAQWLDKEIPYYFIRHSVKPGITGWAQVRYGYCASLAELKEKFKYDLFYIKNLSLLLDFIIMLETIKILIIGKGVR